MTKKMPRSVKKFIRREKARIRAQFLDVKKQREEIAELYKKLAPVEKVVTVKAKKEKAKAK